MIDIGQVLDRVQVLAKQPRLRRKWVQLLGDARVEQGIERLEQALVNRLADLGCVQGHNVWKRLWGNRLGCAQGIQETALPVPRLAHRLDLHLAALRLAEGR